MEPAVILFFASILIVTAMICWTTVSVTQKIIAYKTASQQLAAAKTSEAELTSDTSLDASDATLGHKTDERSA